MKKLSIFAALCSLAMAGLSTAARADTVLIVDFQNTDTTSGDVLQGNLTIDETTDTITGVASDFSGASPDPSFTFTDLNGDQPLFNVGDSITATAVPGTSQVISDSTTGVTLDWTSVTSVPFACSACLGGAYTVVSFNGTGGGPPNNTIQVGGVVEDSMYPGDYVLEMEGTNGVTPPPPPPPPAVPEPSSIAFPLAAGLVGLVAWRKKAGAA
ncbi:MAG: hypothetical protein WBE37_14565 [Bryobacteraceae bacterium]